MNETKHQRELIANAEKILGPAKYIPARDRIPREDIMSLRKQGYSLQRIADYYSVSHMTIWRIIKEPVITVPPMEIGRVVATKHKRRSIIRTKAEPKNESLSH